MVSAISSSFSTILGWLHTFMVGLTSTSGTLKEFLPLFAIGIGCSVVLFSIKVLKKFTWGA